MEQLTLNTANSQVVHSLVLYVEKSVQCKCVSKDDLIAIGILDVVVRHAGLIGMSKVDMFKMLKCYNFALCHMNLKKHIHL